MQKREKQEQILNILYLRSVEAVQAQCQQQLLKHLQREHISCDE